MYARRFLTNCGCNVKLYTRVASGLAAFKSSNTVVSVAFGSLAKRCTLVPSSTSMNRLNSGAHVSSTGLVKFSCGNARSSWNNGVGSGVPWIFEASHGTRSAKTVPATNNRRKRLEGA